VVLVDIDGDEAARQAERLLVETGGIPAVGHQADVTDENDVEQLVDELGSRFGRLDQLVNAAGRNARGGFAEMRADWDRVVAVNLWAPALLCHASADLLGVHGGAIVNIGSRTWLSGGPAAYAASKAGLVGLTRALAVELGPRGITVNAVAPSMVITPFTRSGRTDTEFEELVQRHRAMAAIPRLASPEDVANAVAFLASDQAQFITGEVLHVSGGAQLAPRP